MPRGVHNGDRSHVRLTPEQLRQRGAKPGRVAAAQGGLTVDAGAPEPPPELSDEALAEWRRIVPILERQGLLTLADRTALLVYVVAYEAHQDAVRAVAAAKASAKDGFAVVQRGSRSPVAHPARRALRDAQRSLIAAMQELGLSPASRQRLRAQTAKDGAAVNRFAMNDPTRRQ